ncbi:alanine racemase [Hominifimenecus sp. rT4P-3]|uniref:alanine racemase n=1 Tax=Hominifimenecus sp. rT4P-3 TaxID=3242979 RepID=UPI003DA5A489
MMRYCERVAARIDLEKISGNLKRIREHLPEAAKVCAVVKADGYGHGAVAVASFLEGKADFFAVATVKEALDLREAGVRSPILILGYAWPEDYEELIQNEIRFTVFKESDAEALATLGRRLGKPALIHIKVDTGMHRIGFPLTDEAIEIVRRIRTLAGVEVEGIFTHFARADEADKAYTREQLAAFQEFIRRVEAGTTPIPIHHCANSAASMELPEAAMDMVRVGIAMYGLYPSKEVGRDIYLEPALEMKSQVVYVKDVEAGEGISYNHIRRLVEKRRVATIPVGYGDGYPRLLSDKGYVLIRGKRAPILGRICMDQFMVDVTEIPGVSEGDEVTLVGKDGNAIILVEELSDLCGRFNYEFVCGLERRIPRIYV